MDAILTYILTIPLYTLFMILKRSLRFIWVSKKDETIFFNSVADALVDGGYTTERAIEEVFAALKLFRDPPSYGECGFRCDGRCTKCLASGDGSGTSWNESGYYD